MSEKERDGYSTRVSFHADGEDQYRDYIFWTARGAFAAVQAAMFEHSRKGFRLFEVTEIKSHRI